MLTAVGESRADIVSDGLYQGTLEGAAIRTFMSYQDGIKRLSKTLEET